MHKHFGQILLFTIGALLCAVLYAGKSGLLICAIIIALEISLSFENAIFNAMVLRKMPEAIQKIFLTWGILVAIIGMRLLFPLLLVSIVLKSSPWHVLHLAINDPIQYAANIESAHHLISAFGGIFLLMVFLEFVFDNERKVYWLGWVERQIALLGNLPLVRTFIPVTSLLAIYYCQESNLRMNTLVAGVSGFVLYKLINRLSKLFMHNVKSNVVFNQKTLIFSFLYLEFIDASFSFDGVIGALAVSKDIVLITIGLGVGAIFMRAMTVILVRSQIMQKFAYLEHGAYYSLGILALLMLVGINYRISELVIASSSALVIISALLWSMFARITAISKV